ncbi:PREDICTED: A-kinase anchor protein 5 [Chinchilla lanigera]|uniref:A-kinase anchoring protein 5 n=1 Tax=Chinchilla lanigera TaxID=34839 RepID=A0A8C2YV39_CHILA|nr:PREDICTED: A-kinase anchor protein 5 [Chinchilla lanigera]XP_005399186.1 PREDICTED: A-kinase anchor protein 5 [Chinchilla lanigera]
MQKCSVKMEATVSEIQVENKDEKRAAEVSPQDEGQKERTSVLCFKRRKKAAKVLKPKTGAEAAAAARKAPLEAGASDQPQRPGGAWASIKGLVTRRKRSDPSKQQKPSEAQVQREIKAEDADLSKKKAKSRLKIPCINFSRGARKSHRSKTIEDPGCSVKGQGQAEALAVHTQTQSNDQATKPKSTQGPSEGVSQKDGDEFCESNVSNSVVAGENVVSVELEIDNGHSAIQTGTLTLEKETEVMEETRSVQSQRAGPLESSEAVSQQPVASDATPSPATPAQQTVGKPSDSSLEGEADQKDLESGETAAEEENKPRDTELGEESDLKENEINAEKPKSEESRRMEPIAIIITDTEVSEFDAKKSKNVPKHFLISTENEQVGFFANDRDFEGRTSEQYETLLIETASSLVKNAIQLSIEQLVNEMASEDNKINTLLQ